MMSRKKYIVELTCDEREHLKAVISKGRAAAKTILKARILLKADQGSSGEGWSDRRICQALESNETMVVRVRRQLVEEGMTAVLSRKKRETPPITPIFDGEGHGRWSIRLLADKVVELKIVERAHFNTVGRALKKTISNRI